MKNKWIFLAAMTFLALPLVAHGGDKVRLKYVRTLLTDAGGGQLRAPAGVSVHGKFVFVADSGNKRVIRYLNQGGEVKPDAVFPLPKLVPLMVQVGSKGDLYVLDGKDRLIYRLGPNGEMKGKLVPRGLPDSRKIVPRSIKVGQEGALYILDIFSSRVLVLDRDGKYQRQLPFPADYGFFSDVAVDGQGNIFLLDSVRGAVSIARKGESTFQAMTGSMKNNMNFPTSLAADGRGVLFLVDQNGGGLALLGPNGSFLGRRLSMGWRDSQLRYPSGICISAKGDLFIADKGNNRVQQFTIME